jgi:hypothetical protein
MKTFLVLCLLNSFSSFAVPVINRNVSSTGSSVTIWPDHKDPHQFYYAPTRMNVALDKDGRPQLAVIDYNEGSCRWIRRCSRRMLLSTYFEAAYNELDLKAAKDKILSTNPKANFVPVPFVSSQVEFGTALSAFIDEHNCAPAGGQASDLVPCTIILNEKGILRLLPLLSQGKMLAFNFSYRIMGAVESASGQFRDYETEYSIAVNLGGQMFIGLDEFDIH